MNIIVHLMFAVTLRQRVKRTMGIKLNLPGFLYGNILPDISKKYGAHAHYMKDALEHVIKTNDHIIKRHREEYLSNYQFAKEVGAINHYLSDFFCLPHTERYDRGKIYHQYYEFLMIARFRKGLRAYHKMLKNDKTMLKPSEVEDFIINYNKDYADKKISDVNDIRYALFAGIKLVECMVAHSVLPSSFVRTKVSVESL